MYLSGMRDGKGETVKAVQHLRGRMLCSRVPILAMDFKRLFTGRRRPLEMTLQLGQHLRDKSEAEAREDQKASEWDLYNEIIR